MRALLVKLNFFSKFKFCFTENIIVVWLQRSELTRPSGNDLFTKRPEGWMTNPGHNANFGFLGGL